MTANDQWKKVEKLLADVEEAQGRRLQLAERRLIENLMDALSGGVDKAKTADLINAVFDKFGRETLKPIVDAIAKEIVKTVEAVQKYFELQVSGSLPAMAQKVSVQILKSFGIERNESTFKVLAGGYLDSLINNDVLKGQVQKIVMDAAFGQTKFSDMMKTLGKVVEGTPSTEGALQKHFKTMAFDTMNIAARAQEDRIATTLDMQAFLYSGTVIDATRCFCRERANTVILVTEAEKEWPELIGEDCGPRWDKETYKPLHHMGGHRCRHHKRYISNEEAIRRDRTLKLSEDKLKRA